jgi:hypothetical protein
MRNIKLLIAHEAIQQNHHPEAFFSILDQEIPMDDRIYLSPFDLGFHMYCQNHGVQDNPYDSGIGDYDRWEQGWYEAQHEEAHLRIAIGDVPDHSE